MAALLQPSVEPAKPTERLWIQRGTSGFCLTLSWLELNNLRRGKRREAVTAPPTWLDTICVMTWIRVHFCVMMIFSHTIKYQPNLLGPIMLSSTHPPSPEEIKATWGKFRAYFVIYYHSSNLALIIRHFLFRCKPTENIFRLKQKVIPENWTFKKTEFRAINKAWETAVQMISQLAKGSYLYSPQNIIK